MRYSVALATAMLASPLAAADLRIVTEAPVTHSLVSMVLGDDTGASVLLDRGGDPHAFQLRPAQARDVAEADAIFWMGPDFTPWMTRAMEGVETEARIVTLLEADGLHLQDFLHGHDHEDAHGHGDALGHDHDHGHDHADEHGHGHDHDHGDEHEHDHGHDHDQEDDHGRGNDHDHGHDAHDHDHGHDHAHDHGHDHDHAHDGLDPHAWLYTDNAIAWLGVIAEELSALDPDNAETYAANAAAAQEEIAALADEVAEILAPAGDAAFVVFHDAYGYLAHQFGLNVAGTIALGDAATPGAQRLSALRDELRAGEVVCIFPEVNHSSRYVDMLVEGTEVRVGAELDPAGVTLDPGAALYPTLMRDLAREIAACIDG